MDRLDAMAALAAIVDGGSFSAASRRSGVPLPTLSRKIADLEARLNTRLLVRSTRKLSLTDSGAAYLTAARRILEQVDEAERAAAGEWSRPRGELIVAAPVVFGRLHVLPTVTAFLDAFPEIDVRLVLSDRNADMLDDRVDLAVRIGALPDSGLVAVTVGHLRHMIVAARSVIDRHGVPQRPEALSTLPCVLYEGLSEARSWTFVDPNRRTPFTVTVRPRLTVNTVEAGMDAARAGVGFARMLSYQRAAAGGDGALRVVLEPYAPPAVPVSLLHGWQGPLPLKTRSFLDFAAARLKRALADREIAAA